MRTQSSSTLLQDAKSGINKQEHSGTDSPAKRAFPQTVWVGGLPFPAFTMAQALEHVEHLIRQGEPCFFATVNLHTAMLAHQDAELRKVLHDTAFNVADGAPLVWLSRLRKRALPERIAGADFIPALCELSARQGYRLFLLGGESGVADKAADNLRRRYPGVCIVGIEAPPFHAIDDPALVDRIRSARPDLLFVAFGQPKGELWLRRHCETLGVPVCAQVGATIDFLAGRVPRAPHWVQRSGMEWAYRLYQEPRRLLLRYCRNMLFLLGLSRREVLSALRSALCRDRVNGDSERERMTCSIVQ
jgi:N-acetylglucosaminyldiphosphoundecaprenol N-acetyl-beta-D-mannosaminyltransferase